MRENGLSVAQIASALDITTQAVYQHLKRIRSEEAHQEQAS